MKDNNVKQFFHNHKTEIFIAVGIVSAVGLTCLGIKYIPKLKYYGADAIDVSIKELPHKDIWGNPSGESLTPTKLGNVIFKSNQFINKRLVDEGLQVKLPCGEYRPTELGSKFGVSTIKVTKTGHTFSNIEWDKKVLEIICTPDELKNAETLRQQILNAKAV